MALVASGTLSMNDIELEVYGTNSGSRDLLTMRTDSDKGTGSISIQSWYSFNGAPDAPTNAALVDYYPTLTADLTWTAGTSQADNHESYNVGVSVNGGGYTFVTNTANEFYNGHATIFGNTYQFRVRSVTLGGRTSTAAISNLIDVGA